MSNKTYFIIAVTFIIILISGCINKEPQVGGLNVAFKQDIQDNEINSTFERINFNVNYTWKHIDNVGPRSVEGRKIVWVFIDWTPATVSEEVAKKWQSELESENGVMQTSLVYVRCC
jgi:hypothetical protein